MLTPECHIHFQATPMNGNLNAARDGILLAHTIEYYIYGADKNFPQTIQAKKVSEHIEIFAL